MCGFPGDFFSLNSRTVIRYQNLNAVLTRTLTMAPVQLKDVTGMATREVVPMATIVSTVHISFCTRVTVSPKVKHVGQIGQNGESVPKLVKMVL